MALEKWLYDEIEGNRRITQWVRYIFAHAESLAFAGVLVSVGLRYPALFTRELRPLLGNFHIYEVQLNWALQEAQEVWKIVLSGQGQPAIKWGVEWHRMPHRRFILRDTAPVLMLDHEETKKYLSERVAEWAKQTTHNDKDRDNLRFFLARFDPKNYTQTLQPDGSVMITMCWPPELEAIAAGSTFHGLSPATCGRRHQHHSRLVRACFLGNYQPLCQSRLGDESQGTGYLWRHRAGPNSFSGKSQLAKRSRPDGISEFAVA